MIRFIKREREKKKEEEGESSMNFKRTRNTFFQAGKI